MSEPDTKHPKKRLIIGCLLLFVFGGVIPALVFVALMTGFLRSKGVGVPDEEAVALEAKYSEAADAIAHRIRSDDKLVPEAGAAARAKLPPDAAISADWDLQVELRKVWTREEGKVIGPLSHSLAWEHADVEKTMGELRTRLKSIRGKRPLTEIEERFDPNARSNDDVLESFKDFVLELRTLDEMEAAVLHDVWPMTLETVESYEEYDNRFYTGLRLLTARAITLAERGDTSRAMVAATRLCKLHATMLADTYSGGVLPLLPLSGAVRALRLTAAKFEDEAALLTCVSECVASLPSFDAYVAYLRVNALVMARIAHPSPDVPNFMEAEQDLRNYRALDQACLLEEMLKAPTEENEAKAEVILQRFEPLPGNGSESGLPSPREMLDILSGDCMTDYMSWADTRHLWAFYRYLALAFVDRTTLETVLALGQHKAATDAYPDSFDALVPDGLTAIPIDPISGKPLIYELEGDGYRLLRPVAGGDADVETKPVVLWEMKR
ncbi:MAG: hypothetical protein GY851_21230 [bacterium]|nr:hypothetical protein [bacterium]